MSLSDAKCGTGLLLLYWVNASAQFSKLVVKFLLKVLG